MSKSTFPWRRLSCTLQQLRLDHVLKAGQSFRWFELTPGHWTGVLDDHIWTLMQNQEYLLYQVRPCGNTCLVALDHSETITVCKKPGLKTARKRNSQGKATASEARNIVTSVERTLQDNSTAHITTDHHNTVPCKLSDCSATLTDYFQLKVDTEALHKMWQNSDPNFKKLRDLNGIRILRIDPTECLFSFICSSNNNIARITGMVEKLCRFGGRYLGTVEGREFYSFPSIESLAKNVQEEDLRRAGFGFRGRYVANSARHIAESCAPDWLISLRDVPYEEAKRQLMQLCGVGAKIADCVCLMSLDKSNAIPVDTHIFQTASRLYLPKLRSSKSISDSVYKEISAYLRDLWGSYAGWAQAVLFYNELATKGKVKNSNTG